jgi:hypothetical protein
MLKNPFRNLQNLAETLGEEVSSVFVDWWKVGEDVFCELMQDDYSARLLPALSMHQKESAIIGRAVFKPPEQPAQRLANRSPAV